MTETVVVNTLARTVVVNQVGASTVVTAGGLAILPASQTSLVDALGNFATDNVEYALAALNHAAPNEWPKSRFTTSPFFDVLNVDTATGNVLLTTGIINLVRFSVSRPITVNAEVVWSDTVVSVGVTVGLVGLYAVTDDGESYPLARSANDTTLFNVAQTTYRKTFATAGGWPASVTLFPGRWYAAALLVAAGTLPTVTSTPVGRTQMVNYSRGRRNLVVSTELIGNVPATDSPLGQVIATRLEIGGPVNLGRRAVLYGDSFFATYSVWAGLGNAQGGSRLHFVHLGAVGGEGLTAILVRWATDVVAYHPEWVVLHGGVNDLANGAAPAIIANYQAAIALAAAAGFKLLICVPPPPSTWADANVHACLVAVRAYLLGLGTSIPNVVVVDTGIAMSTGDGTTQDATKLVDTVHPNALGVTALANAFDDAVVTIT